MTLQVEIFNEEGDVLGIQDIYYSEVGEKFVDGCIVTLIELGDIGMGHMDDVIATLDLIYGFFKYEIR